jgi:surfeit locus 1 family protein
LLSASLIAATLVLIALGVWQLQRRVWKLELISEIEQRIHAPVVEAPGPGAWPAITDNNAAYRHVRAAGRWLSGRDTLVQAVTVLGAGFWVMSPLQTDSGFTVLVNRGFVAADDARSDIQPAPTTGSEETVTGLLRVSEPKGGFLHANDAASNRWYSRDVTAIARARGLDKVAPYFIDADAGPDQEAPVGGLTVVRFPNNHLVYALTWFTLAAMALGGLIMLLRDDASFARATPRPK